jgi:hypothetical protein
MGLEGEDIMMTNAAYAGCVQARRWAAAATIGGTTEHAVRMRHDQDYRAGMDAWRRNSENAGRESGLALTAHGRRQIDTSFAVRAQARILALRINDRPVSELYIARCVGCHVESLRELLAGYFHGTDGLRERIDVVLTRLEAGEVIIPVRPVKTPVLSADDSQWVDDIRAALEQAGMTVTDLAIAIRRPLNTVYKLSAKCRPPSQQLRAEIEAAMAMIRERAA